MVPLSPEQAISYRDHLKSREDGDMFLDVGFFLAWYGVAEMAVTTLLFIASNTANDRMIDILTKGLDFRGKAHRLRQLAGDRLGVNLSRRIKYIEEKAMPLRNDLCHSGLTHSEKETPAAYFASSLSRLPHAALGFSEPAGALKPRTITPGELLGWGHWFSMFNQDCGRAVASALVGGAFEVDHPHTTLPEPRGQRAQQ